MRSILIGLVLWVTFLGVLLVSQIIPSGYTRIELTAEEGRRTILSDVLTDGEPVILTWRNSQFGLHVTEIFFARSGVLIQDRVTFSAPDGAPPPRASARDVDDLYHTGGAFDARGLSRPFSRIVYRIGEIGDPKMRVKKKTAALKKEAGFGGRVILATSRPALHEIIFHR
ncbi:MAG: hypothetical protein IH628_14695 [Proteobacteria bacterium]|nr:hypothetical protein [Pseudomonadota bacterium]